MRRRLTNLEYLLLSLLHQGPASGYVLRKAFASTPLGHYSDSPGSIYPALQRLRRRGMLRAVIAQPASGRGTQLFSITAKALAELCAWVQQPISREEVRYDPPALMLRFVVCAQLSGNAAAHRFLIDMESSVNEIIQELETYLRGPGKALTLAGRLAVEQGLESYRALVAWAARAGQRLKRSDTG